jgi:uncharacterized cupin superfamily protein
VTGGRPCRAPGDRGQAGDLAAFPRGWAGTWEIHETLTKAYVTF